MPILVVACTVAAGCAAETCPTLEAQPEANEVDAGPEVMEDCNEQEDEEAPAETEDEAPKLKGAPENTHEEAYCANCCIHLVLIWLCPICGQAP